jgi:membrane protein YdbS with pleckstrin-like domain
MPFPQRLLNAYESVVEDLHPHWIFLSGPVFAVVGGIVLTIIAAVVDTSGTFRTVTLWAALAVLAVAVVALIARYLKWVTTNFVITSDRLIFREGVFAKTGIEIPLERVNNVSLRQTFLGRLVKTGSLLIESGGEDGQQRFSHIRGPERIQNVIHAQIEANGRSMVAPVIGAPDIAGQLEKLEGLLQRGTLTQAEFDAQKAKLLGA